MRQCLETRVGSEHSFNTGRYYGPGGQPINVRVVSEVPESERLLPSCREWVVRFEDVNRKITGEVKVMAATYISQTEIMREYDEGRYTLV